MAATDDNRELSGLARSIDALFSRRADSGSHVTPEEASPSPEETPVSS